ncbi:MAG: ArsR/SmtB family transcription factor [Micromonosporaceae bacterium]
MPEPAEKAASAPQAPTADAVFKALADPHRRQILHLVQLSALPAGQIAAQFEMTQQAVSLHLAVLKKAGLLTERRDGTRRLYQLRPEALALARAVLDEFWPDALARLKQAVETDHPRGDDPQP